MVRYLFLGDGRVCDLGWEEDSVLYIWTWMGWDFEARGVEKRGQVKRVLSEAPENECFAQCICIHKRREGRNTNE